MTLTITNHARQRFAERIECPHVDLERQLNLAEPLFPSRAEPHNFWRLPCGLVAVVVTHADESMDVVTILTLHQALMQVTGKLKELRGEA